MNTEKFTPGEWEVEGCNVVLKEYPKQNRCFGYGCDDRFICSLDDGEYHQYHDDKEMSANAHLIAAAPEMYKVLEQIEDVMSDSSDCGTIPIEKIEAVLRKARGEYEQ